MVFIVVGFILGFFMGYTCIWSTFYGVTIDTIFRRGTGTSRKAICGSSLVTKLVHRLPVFVTGEEGSQRPTSLSNGSNVGVRSISRTSPGQGEEDPSTLPTPPPSYFQTVPLGQYNGLNSGQYNGLNSGQFNGLNSGQFNGIDSGQFNGINSGGHFDFSPKEAEAAEDGPYLVDPNNPQASCSNGSCLGHHGIMVSIPLQSPCPSMISNSSSTEIPLYQRDRDFGAMPPIGSAEAEFQNDFIAVFPMRHLAPQPDLR